MSVIPRGLADSTPPAHPLLRGSSWLNALAPLRHLLGPYLGALISLNLLAAQFSHANSDASMGILHGYTSIGLIPGLLTCLPAIRLMLQTHRWPEAVLAVLWLLANVLLLVVNTWIAVQGMDIPDGNLIHLALAGVIGVNLRLAWTCKQRSTPIKTASGQDLWRRQ